MNRVMPRKVELIRDLILTFDDIDELYLTGSSEIGGWHHLSDWDFVCCRKETFLSGKELLALQAVNGRSVAAAGSTSSDRHSQSYYIWPVNLIIDGHRTLDDWRVATDYAKEIGCKTREHRIAAFAKMGMGICLDVD